MACRFIPAPAGNTPHVILWLVRIPVHPRACGEHMAIWTFPARNCGSSPRLRGTHLAGVAKIGEDRFIPAPAGNTAARQNRASRGTVHPRACGEHPMLLAHVYVLVGSSPRLRGTHHGQGIFPALWRFIPAPAGNTAVAPARWFGTTVHPRACGEHPSPMIPHRRASGSSPRLRGTHIVDEPAVRGRRFIPAPAGNTFSSAAVMALGPVHPRACGEHINRISFWARANGSSPRLRGTPSRHPHQRRRHRFIPAPAGNTSQPTLCGNTDPVHPRACGEHICPI